MLKPLTVIIPTYNRPTYLSRTLNALLPQLGKQDEVVVVNDGGEHPTLPEAVMYVWQKRKGYRLATSRNNAK